MHQSVGSVVYVGGGVREGQVEGSPFAPCGDSILEDREFIYKQCFYPPFALIHLS